MVRPGRTVTIGTGGGLNERFGRLNANTKTQGTDIAKRRAAAPAAAAPAPTPRYEQAKKPVTKSVFARIGGGDTTGGLTRGGGVSKRGGRATQRSIAASAARGIQKVFHQNQPMQRRQPQRQAQQPKQFRTARGSRAPTRQGRAAPQAGKPKRLVKKGLAPTAASLDKELDSYMLKDPSTAQAKLDEELNSYMTKLTNDDDGLGL
ncbi:hypothetical protein DM01DRAFT_1382514 [Hesseltinella vesiculosa]|uniref:Chromatin target of PRMT1 protein C-terminal domain-containing protein n=1 Tax=Hesseltinella vesiculosa TaxID=101127 RepID=A0A1X2GKX7_9FUNG|nr:hypothetical protein DM01DRAFT_1382514 [Hesseltinella vesiculosa]